MTEIVLYHHIQGLTPGIHSFAEELRNAGHTVHTPDLFDAHTFESIEEGFANAKEVGFETLRERGRAEADRFGSDLIYAGVSFGVTIAQGLAQTRAGARGAVLLESCLPASEFDAPWPTNLPAQIHGNEGDEFFAEDLPSARQLADDSEHVELFVYAGDKHLFSDSSLASYEPEAAALMLQRVKTFLASL